jgi:hypothetical protein
MAEDDYEKKQRAAFEQAAKDLANLLGASTKIGKNDSFKARDAIDIELTNGAKPTDSMYKWQGALFDKIEKDLLAQGWRRENDNPFQITDNGKLQFQNTEVSLLKTDGSWTRKNVPIAEFLTPYKDDLKKIIADTPAEIQKQVAADAKAMEPAKDYATQLQTIAGTKIDAIAAENFRSKEYYLVIPIGNGEAADKAIDTLAVLRAKSGLDKESLSFILREDSGEILIPVKNIVDHDTKNGAGSLFKKLAPVKSEFAQALKTAKEDAAKINAMPTLEKFKDIGNGDFNYKDKGLDNSQYQRLDIKGGDFKLPDSVKAAALEYVKEMRGMYKEAGIDPIQSRELAPAAKLNGDGKALSDEEFASFLLAKSMSRPQISSQGELSVRFGNYLSSDAYYGRDGKDPKVVFEMAKQILGDTYGAQISGGVDTKTPEGDKAYIETAKNSPSTDHMRC